MIPRDQFPLRLPDGMRERLKAAAAGNNRTMNAEIVERLEYSLPGGKGRGVMSSRLFRIGDKQIALAFVTQFQVLPGDLWLKPSDNDPRAFKGAPPRLYIQLLGNSDLTIYQPEAEAAGYKDAHAVAEALRAALEAL